MSKKSSPSKPLKNPNAKDQRNDPSTLPGWPGYRTRDGRTGYDPIDTRSEAAHTTGTIIQKLIYGNIRNRIQLFLLTVLGLALIAPLVVAISETMNGNLFPWNAWILILITGFVGLAVLVNCIKNPISIIRIHLKNTMSL
jgi:hypothetical protein